MKKTTALLLLALATGCGGSSASSPADAAPAVADAPTTPADTTPAADDGQSAAGACNVPTCITALGAACVPDGACISQISIATMGLTICYANGLRYQEAVSGTGAAATATISASNGPTPCFTGTANTSTLVGSAVTFTLKNPAGTQIGTMTQNTTTGATTITCAGGEPVPLNAACSGGGACTFGTCL